jgi:hypothetical protein
MIGVNGISSEVFSLADAQALLDYAQTDSNIVRLAMWSVARDNGNSAGAYFASPDSSGIAPQPYDFSAIFRQFDRGAVQSPPNSPPPAGTTADMILRHSTDGLYEIYDIGNNAILAGYQLGQVGTDWQFAGLGGFQTSHTTDMLLLMVAREHSKSTISATIRPLMPLRLELSGSTGRSRALAISQAEGKPTCSCAIATAARSRFTISSTTKSPGLSQREPSG